MTPTQERLLGFAAGMTFALTYFMWKAVSIRELTEKLRSLIDHITIITGAVWIWFFGSVLCDPLMVLINRIFKH